MVDENFQMMGYAAVTAMVGARNLVMYIPLIIHAVLVTSQISLKRSQPVLGRLGFIPKLGFVTKMMEPRLGNQPARNKLKDTKHDMEVYLGFYLIIVWFLGWSHAIAIMLFWQMMRVRVMVSPECQKAWGRFDQTLHRVLLDKAFCPAIVNTGYDKVKTMLVGMA